ncbi:MAG: hypothetical protein AAGE52_36790 [Myxococcota bacterium]
MPRCGLCISVLAFPLAFAACGAPQPSRVSGSPSTEADPPPYTPPPSETATTGTTTALATSGGGEQAKAVAIRFVRGVVEGNEDALVRLLATDILTAQPRLTGQQRLRSDIVTQALQSAQRRRLGGATTVDTFIDANSIQVQPLSQAVRQIPNALRPSDLYVTVPLLPTGQRVFRFLINGWHHRGVVIVRAGAEPRIVGL